jgi:hypothetical protein
MKPPARLQTLIDEGLIDSVQRQLMSGKEAMVFVVRCGDETRCAKVYKEATHRSFRQAVDYTENRKVKNMRQARAMAKGTRFGRESQEAAWQSAEVDALYRLAGVRVPKPYNFHEGVLLMELIADADGAAAPRLNDCEFDILLAAGGPVIIDLPQAVDAAGNNHAQRMLLRVQRLLVASDHLAGGRDQHVECGGVERLGVLLVAAHRLRAGKCRLGLNVTRHRDRPAFIAVVLDDAGAPAVVAPEAGLVDRLGGGVHACPVVQRRHRVCPL